MEEQLELDFTSECPEEARELGIRWAPRNATPEETKEWIETENKWWSDRALHFVAIASIIQFVMMGLMLLSFWGINTFANG
tara:strand:- start:391 stop:633 length:243 start_codon:yes stop_codon:yes gene_type:complete